MPIARRLILGLVAAAAALALLPATGHAATDPCATPVTNPVACENSKPGDAPADWEVDGDGDATIQGFATQMSVNVGQDDQLQGQDVRVATTSTSCAWATTAATARA